jgi:hypothetical protein
MAFLLIGNVLDTLRIDLHISPFAELVVRPALEPETSFAALSFNQPGENQIMKLTLLAATLAVLAVTACGKPNQALPEQEKDNFAKVISQPAAPAEPDSAAEASTGDSTDSSTSSTEAK